MPEVTTRRQHSRISPAPVFRCPFGLSLFLSLSRGCSFALEMLMAFPSVNGGGHRRPCFPGKAVNIFHCHTISRKTLSILQGRVPQSSLPLIKFRNFSLFLFYYFLALLWVRTHRHRHKHAHTHTAKQAHGQQTQLKHEIIFFFFLFPPPPPQHQNQPTLSSALLDWTSIRSNLPLLVCVFSCPH